MSSDMAWSGNETIGACLIL